MAKIIVSKPGFNALTETNLNNLTFSSEHNTLKYFTEGSVSKVVAGSSVEETITHNLGYVPFYVVYYNDPIATTDFSMTPLVFEGMGVYTYIEAYADTTTLRLTVQTNSLNATVTFFYKIFRNRTNL